MIISPADFIERPYKIPNQNEATDLVSILEAEEEELAIGYLFGPEMWEEFNAAAQISGVVPDPWKNLLDGADYTHSGKTYRYKGWINTIKPALYAHWIPLTTDKLTNIGFVTNNAPLQSKLQEDYYPYVVKYWNDFVLKVGQQIGNYGYNCKGTLYGFLNANKSDYPTWHFKCPQLKNRHDF